MTTHTIEVTLAGQPLKLAVAPEDEGALRAAVSLVDAEFLRIRNSTRSRMPERTVLMAAVSVASKLIEERRQHAEEKKSPHHAPEGQMRTRMETMHHELDRLTAQLELRLDS